jgi:putative ABC transport system ATP-binding protein
MTETNVEEKIIIPTSVSSDSTLNDSKADLLVNKDLKEESKSEDEKKTTEESVEKSGPIISARNLDFIYNPGKTNEYHALIDISFDIFPEEFIMIFGPSGCGKSTLLNVIAGLEKPDKGSILVMGQDLTKMNAHDFAMYHRSQVGMIYQAYNLITSLTVLENVVLPQIFINIGKKKRELWGRELLERFGILTHADKIPTELSGGQQQRIGIARSIVNNPQLILADEPMGNLDSSSAKMALGILGDLNEKEKKTIIMVTHNPEHLDYADRVLYMKDGVITREVINRDKKKDKEIERPKTAVKEINELMRAYQGMTPEQINILIMPYKSKVFAHHFISSRNMEETKIFEEAIQRRLLGTISEAEFFNILDKPSIHGGVGFDSRTVESIIKRINLVVKMSFFVYQKYHQAKNEQGIHDKVTYEEKALKVRDYLLETCYASHNKLLNEEQIDRIKRFIKERLTEAMDKTGFYSSLDTPFKEGGVGLNSKTAKAISEELELILILGFGVVGVSEKMAAMSRSERNIERAKQEEFDDGLNTKAKPEDVLAQMNEQLSKKISTVNSTTTTKEELENQQQEALSEKNSANSIKIVDQN